MASGTWTGAVSNVWPLNGNWSGVSYPGTAASETATLDLGAGASISLNGTSITNLTVVNASGGSWAITRTGTETFYAGTITANSPLTLSAPLSGTGAFTKAGTDTLTLTLGATNTGAWSINAGTLNVTTTAISTATGVVSVGSSASITTSVAFSKPLNIGANSTGNTVIFAGSAAVTVNGTLSASGASTRAVTVNSGGNFTLTSGSIGALTVASGATAYITGNTGLVNLSGNVTLDAGSTSTAASQFSTAAGVSNISILTGRNLGLTGTPAFAAVTGAKTAVFQKGGSVSYSGTAGSEALVLGDYDYCFYLGTGGTFGGSGTAPIQLIRRVGAGESAEPSVFHSDGSTLTHTNGAFGQVAYATRSSPAAMHFYGANKSHTSNALALGGTGTVTPVTHQVLFSIESGSTYTATAGASSTSNSTAALVSLTVKDASTLVLGGATGSNATPKHINLSDASKLTVTTNTTISGFSIYLYGNSNKISTETGAGVIAAPIASTENTTGVSAISFSGGGTNYIGAPQIRITGGDGSGAVARVQFDPNTNTLISPLVIISHGTGYTSDPVVSFLGGGGSVVTPTGLSISRAANVTDGTLTKTGAGETRLTGANTYTGKTTVSAGTLTIGNNAAAGTLGTDTAPEVLTGATLKFNRSDSVSYALTISGEGGIAKGGGTAGTAILTAASTFTGAVTVDASGGALRAKHSNALGSGATAIVVSGTGGAFELEESALNTPITISRGVTIGGTGVSTNGAIRNIAGNNTISGAVTLAAAARINSDSGTLTLGSASNLSGNFALTFGGASNISVTQPITTGANTVTKDGNGTTILRGTSTYTGVTTVSAGRLGFVGSLTASTNGSFGNASAAASLLIAANAGIRYYGAGGTVTRPYILQGGAATTNFLEADATATGAISINTAPLHGTSSVAKTLGLGGDSTRDNVINFIIANNGGTNAVAVAKADAGKWVLSQNNTTTGAYTVTGGTLVLQGTNTPASVTVSNSNSTLVLQSATGATRTGTATVTVNSGARVQTLTGTTQLGKHTYTGLTLNAGSTLRIGG